jgi:hypothetical protein
MERNLRVPERYNIGNIRAHNVAIGNSAKAEHVIYLDAGQESVQAEALQRIRQLIDLLSVHANEIANPRDVLADAESMAAALSKEKLNRSRIEHLTDRISAAVAGVTVLASAADAVRAAVAQLFM